MRILWLGSGLLLPLDKGGKLRTWHLLRHLAARHEVTFLGFADPAGSAEHVEGMREVCTHLETVPRREVGKGTTRFYADAARRLVDPLPYAAAKYRSRAYRERLARLLETGRFEAVVCDFLVPAVNMPAEVPCPTVLFTHNVEAEIWRRHAETAGAAWRRALLASQWRRMLRFEGHTLRRFASVLAVSDADRETLIRLYGRQIRGPIHVVPTGVDVRYFEAARSVPIEPYRLVFTGSMDWLPNEDAVLHFCRDILPRIRSLEPRATLAIVGRQPTPAVQRLAANDAGIEVTGRVDDIRPHVGRGSVSIVPLRIGGGTRLKIYEAMAMGRPVVSTTVGAEGLPLTPGTHIAIADTADDFAHAVVRLLHERDHWQQLADEAQRLVSERYDWSAVARFLEHAIRTTVVRRTQLSARHGALAVPAAGPLAGRSLSLDSGSSHGERPAATSTVRSAP